MKKASVEEQQSGGQNIQPQQQSVFRRVCERTGGVNTQQAGLHPEFISCGFMPI